MTGTLERPTLKDISLGLIAFCSVALLVAGLSGLLTLAFGEAFGEQFVSGDAPGTRYTDQRCAEFLAEQPGADNCEAAATAFYFDDTVSNRLSAGVLALVLGLVYGLVSLRRRGRLPASISPLFLKVTTVVLGIAGFVLLAFSLMQLAYAGTAGVGADLAGGIVAAVVSLIMARRAGLSPLHIIWPDAREAA